MWRSSTLILVLLCPGQLLADLPVARELGVPVASAATLQPAANATLKVLEETFADFRPEGANTAIYVAPEFYHPYPAAVFIERRSDGSYLITQCEDKTRIDPQVSGIKKNVFIAPEPELIRRAIAVIVHELKQTSQRVPKHEAITLHVTNFFFLHHPEHGPPLIGMSDQTPPDSTIRKLVEIATWLLTPLGNGEADLAKKLGHFDRCITELEVAHKLAVR